MQQNNTQNFIIFGRIFFYCTILMIFFYMFYVQAFAKTYIAEFQNHISLLRQFVFNPLSYETVHPGFHCVTYAISRLSGLSLLYSGVVLLSFTVLITSAMIMKLLRHSLQKKYSEYFLFFITFLLLTLTSIYLPFFNINIYLGQWSGNFYAVPTQVFVKPFALTAFLMYVSFLKNRQKQKSKVFMLMIITVMTASVLVKPNFVFSFMPTVAVYLLLKKNKNIRFMFKTVLLFLPTIIVLLLQFYGNFIVGTGRGISFTFFDVWKEYSPNILVSIVLAIAFPLTVLLARFNRLLNNEYLILSWIFLFFGIIQFIFMAENAHFFAANFSWSYSLGLWFVFIFSTIEYFIWLCENRMNKRNNYPLTIATLMLALHFLSGLIYLLKQLLGLGYS